MIPRTFLLLVLALLAGCGPALRQTSQIQIWRPTNRCVQGPIVLETEAGGTRWGESFTLTIFATKYLKGYYAVVKNGHVVKRGFIATKEHQKITRVRSSSGAEHERIERETVSKTEPENEYCIKKPHTPPNKPLLAEKNTTDASPTGAPEPRAFGAESARRATRNVSLQFRVPKAQGPPLVQLIDSKEMRDILTHQASTGRFVQRIFFGKGQVAVYPCLDRKLRPDMEPKAKIRFIIWFDEPNDFRYALFELQHQLWKPYPNEQKYLAALEKKRTECRKRRHRLRHRSRRRKVPAHLRRHFQPTWCRLPMLRRSLPSGVQVTYRPWVHCDCLRKGPNAPCWGPGGRRGFEKRALDFTWPCHQTWTSDPSIPTTERTLTKGCWCFKNLQTKKCWGPEGYWAYRAKLLARLRRLQRQRMLARRNQERMKRRLAAGPPPSPLQEVKPPRPSPHAVWISGFWKLADDRWYWMKGWWRVPQRDIEQKLTPKVATAPPPPRAERPGVCPVPGSVWTPGAWFWDGHGFSWVPGACRLPPSRRHRWRPGRWRKAGRMRIFVPGGWEITIRK